VSTATEAPDTPRRHLLTLAHRQLSFPRMPVEDEVLMASAVGDRAATLRAFSELCDALRDGEHDVAETVLDLLTGRLR
jgi:hypothetical protein